VVLGLYPLYNLFLSLTCGPLAIAMKAFFDSSSLLADPSALRNRFAQDGYLYLPGLMDSNLLTNLRRQIVDICAHSLWLKSDTDPMDAISWTVPKVEGEEDYFEVYDQVQRLQDFHGLAHNPVLMDVMKTLLDDTAFPHPLSITRLVFPDNEDWTTPPHQDFANNQGTPDLYAAWVPLSDCPTSMGSLAILEGSNHLGLLPLEYSLGAGHRQASLPKDCDALNWVGGDFKLGDAIIFHSLTLHKALANQSKHLRISVDYRYQAEDQNITERCLLPHFEREDWSEIYRGWDQQELMYYWRNKRLSFVPWNDSYGQLPDDHIKTAVKLQRNFNRNREALADKYGDNGNSNTP
jgi:ectoine hydroxylase-related dioxygenase (phytanoyl-CoA dioxygenase family)